MPVGTPDYQYGVVNSQSLIGTLPAGVGTMTVPVPPNAESIIVVTPSTASSIFVTLIGGTTGLTYPGARATSAISSANASTFVFDASSVLDSQVEVIISPVPAGPSYVYADAGVHQVADLSKLGDARGVQFVGPVIPGITSNAHPPNELLFASVGLGASGTLLAAPGAGKRYRIFTAQIVPQAAGLAGYMIDNASGAAILTCGPGIGGQLPFIPQGIPLNDDAALTYFLSSGAGQMISIIVYTIETH